MVFWWMGEPFGRRGNQSTYCMDLTIWGGRVRCEIIRLPCQIQTSRQLLNETLTHPNSQKTAKYAAFYELTKLAKFLFPKPETCSYGY